MFRENTSASAKLLILLNFLLAKFMIAKTFRRKVFWNFYKINFMKWNLFYNSFDLVYVAAQFYKLYAAKFI